MDELKEQIEDIENKLKDANQMKTYYYELYSKAQQQLNELHDLLDYMPSAPPRRTAEEYPRDLSLGTRLTIYFASRK